MPLTPGSSSLLQPHSLPADTSPRPPLTSLPRLVWGKQSPSSPGKVQSEEGIQLQAGAGRAGKGHLGAGAKDLGTEGGGRCLRGSTTPPPRRRPIPSIGSPIFWALRLPEHLPALGAAVERPRHPASDATWQPVRVSSLTWASVSSSSEWRSGGNKPSATICCRGGSRDCAW